MIRDGDSHLERNIQASILEAIRQPGAYPDVVLWENICGKFVDDRGNWRKVGVANPGGSDLVGIFTRPDGVGAWIGAEIKSATGRQSVEQKAHEQFVRSRGGIYVVLRSVEDAKHWVSKLRDGGSW